MFTAILFFALPAPPDELPLLQRARRLEDDALTEVHDRYYQPVFRYIRFRVHDHPTAEDLTSDVFMRFLQAIQDRHAPQNTLRGWLFGTASNVVKDYYRDKKRDQEKSMTLSDTLAERLHDEDGSLAGSVAFQELEEELLVALAQLTEEQQHVLALRFGYGLPIKQVAETMNKSDASVKMLQARALSSLARLMPTDAEGWFA